MEKQMQHHHHYRPLAIMAVLSFATMFVLMYAMVDVWENVYPNLNQAYMAGLMAAPMVVIELVVMRGMYHNKKLNALLIAGSVALGVLFFAGIRQQTFISDTQFIRSMIPHHSGAILMCNEASLQDQELRELCKNINASQAEEIRQMKAILQRLER